MQSSVPNYETGNFIVTLNKSPSRYNSNVPPCISVSDCAIDNPRPLPSVLLDTSPRMNRSVSSEAGMFSGRADIFFRLKHAMPSFFSRSA